ncbi:MAG: hypothetical protein RIQ93_2856 [Verrucomicrobiota bacterium]|jgi:hypothetical protein
MKAATTLTTQEIDQLLTVVRSHWPELDHYETGVFNLALNRVQQIAEREGVAAITPPRVEGLRAIVEEYVLPFAEIARIHDLVVARQETRGHS